MCVLSRANDLDLIFTALPTIPPLLTDRARRKRRCHDYALTKI